MDSRAYGYPPIMDSLDLLGRIEDILTTTIHLAAAHITIRGHTIVCRDSTRGIAAT